MYCRACPSASSRCYYNMTSEESRLSSKFKSRVQYQCHKRGSRYYFCDSCPSPPQAPASLSGSPAILVEDSNAILSFTRCSPISAHANPSAALDRSPWDLSNCVVYQSTLSSASSMWPSHQFHVTQALCNCRSRHWLQWQFGNRLLAEDQCGDHCGMINIHWQSIHHMGESWCLRQARLRANS